jgi:hypothetical protein
MRPTLPGAKTYLGTLVPVADGHQVRALTAHVQDVPAGAKVVGVYAVSRNEYARQGTIGVVPEDGPQSIKAYYPDLRLHPIGDATFGPLPHSPWYLVMVFTGTKPGTYKVGGLVVTYVDLKTGEHGTQTYDLHVALNITASPPASPTPLPSLARPSAEGFSARAGEQRG